VSSTSDSFFLSSVRSMAKHWTREPSPPIYTKATRVLGMRRCTSGATCVLEGRAALCDQGSLDQRDVLNFKVDCILRVDKFAQRVILVGCPLASRTSYSDKAVGHVVYRRFLEANSCAFLGCSSKQAFGTRFRGVESGFS
jgi:hypothetical protein